MTLEGAREGIDDARYLHLLLKKRCDAFLAKIKPLSVAIWGYLAERSGKALGEVRWKITREALKKPKSSQWSKKSQWGVLVAQTDNLCYPQLCD